MENMENMFRNTSEWFNPFTKELNVLCHIVICLDVAYRASNRKRAITEI
jgi:hypothetical protein